MRYRPFGRSGQALSALGLKVSWVGLRRNRQAVTALLTTAIENGINTFHFTSANLEFLKVAAEALSPVNRKVLFISIAAEEETVLDPAHHYELEPLRERLKGAVRESGLQWIDLLVFHAAGFDQIPDRSWTFIGALRDSGLLRFTGATANSDLIKAVVDDGRFNILKTVFDIDTSWNKRHLLDYAIARGMAVFGHDFFPETYRRSEDVVPKAARRGWFSSKPADPMAGAGTYAFLHQTPGWTAEELCLSFALTQPNLSTLFADPETPSHLEALSEVVERAMPTSVPAQIEMARFSADSQRARRA
ncbi:MAG: aldo/keto reductase [Asticcacaulis sp.]